MTGIIKRTTTNYSLRIPIFDAPGWGREVERNFDIIDAVMLAISGFTNISGVWANGTMYTAGQRLVDQELNLIYECNVDHTSAATGTFEDDRTAHPTYWDPVVSAASNKGQWTTATGYFVNDFLYDANRFGVVTQKYTSSGSYDQDVIDGNIVTLLDLSSQLTTSISKAAEAAASAAAALASQNTAALSQTAAGTSETNALASKNAAAASETNAAASAASASASSSNANTKAGQAATSATNAAASEVAAANSAGSASASATAAGNSATASQASNVSSATNAATATTQAGLSQDWATKAEDSPVTVGPDKFSAFHWAQKAAETIAAGVPPRLAAVIGSMTRYDDYNAVPEETGYYLVNIGATNGPPAPWNDYGILQVIVGGADGVKHIVRSYYNTPSYERIKNGFGWQSWDRRRVLDSDIVERLAPLSKIVTDANLAVENGWYAANNAANMPPETDSWFLLRVDVLFSTWVIQSASNLFAGGLDVKYERSQINGVWGAWIKVYDKASSLDTRYFKNTAGVAITTSDGQPRLGFDVNGWSRLYAPAGNGFTFQANGAGGAYTQIFNYDGSIQTSQLGDLKTYIDTSKLDAWGKFTGTTPPVLKKSHGVSSVTRLSMGTYTVNLSAAMPDAEYVVTTGTRGAAGHNTHEPEVYDITTTSFTIQTPSDGGGSYGVSDWEWVSFMVKG